MTTTDTAPPTTGTTSSWWAPAATLRERLSAAHPPTEPPTSPGPAAGSRTRSPIELACESVRAARLGADPRLMAALAAEPAPRLAGRLAKPQWAVFAEAAVAAAPGTPAEARAAGAGAPADPAAGAMVFEPVLRPLVSAAVADLAGQAAADGADPGETAVFAGSYADWLARRLARAAARTLVVELAAARTAGDLSGATGAARFAGFTARTATRAGLARLFAGYPVLARLLARTCRHTARSGAELLARLAADRRELAAGLFGGTDPGPLAAVGLGLGDPHQQGRSVAVLRFAGGGRAVYKPRPVGQHALLDGMADWLAAKVPGLELRTPRWVAGDGYGWLEHIDHRTCRSLAEIDRFHRRQGALIALAHTLEGVDLHYENVLACGEQPVLVDVETLLHPVLREGGTTRPDPAAGAHASSVHRTCLLPQLLVGEVGAVDVSALGGAPGGQSPNTRMVWEDAGTDEMRLVRRPAPFTGALNQPCAAGTGPGGADRAAAVLAGFRTGYDAVVRHRDELSAPAGPLAAGADAVGRLVLRPTMLYATLLEEATHPQVLRDGLDRDAMFAVLWADSDGDPARQALIEYEIADLWDGDVPVFFHRPGSREVLASDGTPVNGVLETSGLACAQAKLAAMGTVDRRTQEWIVSAALASAEPGAGRHHRVGRRARPAPAALPEPSALLAAASEIADGIAGRAVRGHDRANWIGLEAVEDHWTVLPMGAGLAQGYTGVALFLAQFGALTGSARHTGLARAALAPVPELVTAMAADPALSRAVGPGGFEGLGGICYALARVAGLAGHDLAACLPTALDALALAALGDDTPPDVSTGLAGALAALHAVHRERGLPQAAALADRIAERLLESAPAARPGDGPPESLGFAFGEAGIGWALARHARFTGGPLGERSGAAGRARLTAALAAADRLDTGWCSGTAGVLLAAADAGLCPRPGTGPARDAGRLLAGHPPVADLSPCHGELGITEAVAALAGRGHAEARAGLTGRIGLVLGLLHAWEPRCGTPGHVPTPGLLTGLSGIGYALLRLGFADTVPSVLLLDPAQDGKGG